MGYEVEEGHNRKTPSQEAFSSRQNRTSSQSPFREIFHSSIASSE